MNVLTLVKSLELVVFSQQYVNLKYARKSIQLYILFLPVGLRGPLICFRTPVVGQDNRTDQDYARVQVKRKHMDGNPLQYSQLVEDPFITSTGLFIHGEVSN